MSVFHIRLSKARLWGAAYVSLQIIYFAYNFQMFNNDLLYKSFRKSAGFGLPIARASAACISLAAGIILLPVCRNLITIFRQSIIGRILPFDSNIKFHRLLGYSIVLFSALHIGAHTNNLRHVSDNPLATLWTHGTMLTGIALTFILVLMVTASISKVKKPLFEIFFYVHHLYIVR